VRLFEPIHPGIGAFLQAARWIDRTPPARACVRQCLIPTPSGQSSQWELTRISREFSGGIGTDQFRPNPRGNQGDLI